MSTKEHHFPLGLGAALFGNRETWVQESMEENKNMKTTLKHEHSWPPPSPKGNAFPAFSVSNKTQTSQSPKVNDCYCFQLSKTDHPSNPKGSWCYCFPLDLGVVWICLKRRNNKTHSMCTWGMIWVSGFPGYGSSCFTVFLRLVSCFQTGK